MGVFAEPGDGLGKVFGCRFLVHGVLPPRPQSVLTADRVWGLKTAASRRGQTAGRGRVGVRTPSRNAAPATLVGYPPSFYQVQAPHQRVVSGDAPIAAGGLSQAPPGVGNFRRSMDFRETGRFVLYNCHFPLESRSHLCENSWKRAREGAVSHRPFCKVADGWQRAPRGEGRDRCGSTPHRLGACLALGLILVLVAGCTRTYYHDFADRDTYGILKERLFDWRWRLPPRPVEADPKSRMADFADPNYEPIPPDEPAARDFQISNRFPFEYHGWKKRGTAPVEYLDWQKQHPRRVRRQGAPEPGLDHAAGDHEQPGLPVQLRDALPGRART